MGPDMEGRVEVVPREERAAADRAREADLPTKLPKDVRRRAPRSDFLISPSHTAIVADL
jgi:hypothetical protein